MFHNIELQEGAIFISDAHYSHRHPKLLQLIKDIATSKIKTTQLILMGDIFDALFGEVQFTHQVNNEMISLINEISKTIEVIYLEGNHDFNLEVLFPLAKIFPLEKQPLLCSFKNKKIYLSHGDFDGSSLYKIYTFIIRNSLVLSILAIIDKLSNHLILDKLDKYLRKKSDCKEFENFKSYIHNRFEDRFECDFFIEGHFHQNSMFCVDKFHYINLAAFACNQRYFIVELSKDNELLKEIKFSKEI